MPSRTGPLVGNSLAFIDTETTSLRHDKRFWEVALILRQPGQDDVEYSCFVDTQDLDLGNADLQSLTFGRFFERHPWYGPAGDPFEGPPGMDREVNILHKLEEMTRGATLLGSNPSFDAELLAARMRAHGLCPSWHYHHLDVPTLALGWLHGSAGRIPDPPKSDAISLACGVDPAKYERHSALGDCRWIRDLYDTVTAGNEPLPCQPIGCDNGYHLPGCMWAEVDGDAGQDREKPAASPVMGACGVDGLCRACTAAEDLGEGGCGRIYPQPAED